jgi:hypothetical protein
VMHRSASAPMVASPVSSPTDHHLGNSLPSLLNQRGVWRLPSAVASDGAAAVQRPASPSPASARPHGLSPTASALAPAGQLALHGRRSVEETGLCKSGRSIPRADSVSSGGQRPGAGSVAPAGRRLLSGGPASDYVASLVDYVSVAGEKHLSAVRKLRGRVQSAPLPFADLAAATWAGEASRPTPAVPVTALANPIACQASAAVKVQAGPMLSHSLIGFRPRVRVSFPWHSSRR